MASLTLMLMLLLCVPGFSQPEDEKGSGEGGGAHARPGTPVCVDLVKQETVQRMRVVTGEIKPRRISTVASEESGLVIEMPFDSGNRVRAGDILARLDAQLLMLELAEAQAAVAQAEASIMVELAELEQAERDLKSIEDLHAKGAAKPKEMADALTDFTTANAAVVVARTVVTLNTARVNQMKKRIDKKVITAPFDGIVTVKHAEVGQWVGVGGAVVEMIQSGTVDAVIDVSQEVVNVLEIGMRLSIGLPTDSHPVDGVIRAIVPLGDPEARTFPVKVQLDDDNGRIKPGMTAVAWIPTGDSRIALTISKDAILRSETGPYVYVVRGTSVFPAYISIDSAASPTRLAITGDLLPGDAVVTEGNERLYPSAAISIIDKAEFPEGNGNIPTERNVNNH